MALVLAGCSVASSASTTPTPGATSTRSAPSPSPSAATASPTPSAPSRLRVVALGDSVTAGSHCGCTPFPELYGQDLAARERVPTSVTNAGVPGETSAGLLHDLAVDADLDRSVARADVVLVTIGANDFTDQYGDVTSGRCPAKGDQLACVRAELGQVGSTLTAVLRRVQSLRGRQPTTVLVTGYWNVFEDGDVASAKFSADGLAGTDRLTVAANTVIRSAAMRTDDQYVDLYTPFKGQRAERDPTPLLADDGDHPDAAGHRVIANALLAQGPAH